MGKKCQAEMTGLDWGTLLSFSFLFCLCLSIVGFDLQEAVVSNSVGRSHYQNFDLPCVAAGRIQGNILFQLIDCLDHAMEPYSRLIQLPEVSWPAI